MSALDCPKFELLAIGPRTVEFWRKSLPADQVVCLGRSPREGWAVPWDKRISREHADLLLVGSHLHVRCLASARNSLHQGDKRSRSLVVGLRDEFRIGETRFCLVLAGEEVERQREREEHSAVSPATDDDRWNRHVGSYLLIEEVHRGARAEVHMARHTFLDRWAAVQCQRIHGSSMRESADRLRQKAKLLAWLRHPHIPLCHDAGEVQGLVYLAMDWIHGTTLATRLTEREISLDCILEYVRQAASGLACAQAYGIIHHDVSPDHLMVDHDDQVAIIGWSGAERVGETSLLTNERLLNSPAQLASPISETQQEKLSSHTHVDIRGLGWTLFTLLTRKDASTAVSPSPSGSSGVALPPKIRAFRPETPEPVQECFERMIDTSCPGAFGSMIEVLQALESL